MSQSMLCVLCGLTEATGNNPFGLCTKCYSLYSTSNIKSNDYNTFRRWCEKMKNDPRVLG